MASVQPCAEQPPICGPRLGLEQGVVSPALGLVDVGVGRDDVIVAGEHDRAIERDQLGARAAISRSIQASL